MIEPIKKKNSNVKKIILGSFIGILIGSLLSVSYAVYTYANTGMNNKLVVGDIYMKYKDNNELSFQNAMPSTTYTQGKYFEFEVTGKNTTTDKDIYYDIVLNHGIDNPNSRTTRLDDKFLKFRLVEVENYGEQNETENELIASRSFNTINNTRLYKTTISKNTTSDIRHIYRLYAWISYNVRIGNVDQDYTEQQWVDVYASIKVTVTGDFTDKEITPGGVLASTKVISRYNSSGQDGLYAVNTSGDLYDGTGTIREYRYSGATPNNYVYFNGNELWRIVGVFDGELKIVKDTNLTNAPVNYTHTDPNTNEEIVFDLSSEGTYGSILYWNRIAEKNDWSTAGLQYYLNDNNNQNSYWSSLNQTSRDLIKTNTTYYLGSVDYNMNFPVKTAYEKERDSTNVYSGNSSALNNSIIGLLYISDIGYANSIDLWNRNLSSYSHYDSVNNVTVNDFGENNWLIMSNQYIELTIAPAGGAGYNRVITYYHAANFSNNNVKYTGSYVRPTLYLKSDTRIYDGDGSYNNPYKLIES